MRPSAWNAHTHTIQPQHARRETQAGYLVLEAMRPAASLSLSLSLSLALSLALSRSLTREAPTRPPHPLGLKDTRADEMVVAMMPIPASRVCLCSDTLSPKP